MLSDCLKSKEICFRFSKKIINAVLFKKYGFYCYIISLL